MIPDFRDFGITEEEALDAIAEGIRSGRFVAFIDEGGYPSICLPHQFPPQYESTKLTADDVVRLWKSGEL